MDVHCNAFSATCFKILSYGDTLVATNRLRQYYNEKKSPCTNVYKQGKILFTLGDKIMMDDCLRDMYNFRAGVPNECIWLIFEYPEREYYFDVLADAIATEKHSRFRKGSSEQLWRYVFNELPDAENKWTKPILIELFSNVQSVKELRLSTTYWERRYKEDFHIDLRVCDFALLKYFELFPESVMTVDWKETASIDLAIEKLLKDVKTDNN